MRIFMRPKVPSRTDPEAVVASDDVEEIIDLDNVDPRQLKVYKGLLLSIAFSASIGGTGTLIGTGANIVLTGYLQK
jgi:Na+/H+ antiporter NhaD/arsenite permease-like protein